MKLSAYSLLTLAFLMLASRAGSSTPSPSPPDSGIESSIAWGEPERQGWLRDFRQLIDEMSSHYANLEWAVKERHMDLARLRSETEARILSARSAEEERRAFRDFAAAFGDGHLKITWPDENKAPAASPPPDGGSDDGSLCARLGYTVRGRTGLDLSLLQGFRPVPDGDQSGFPGGILRLAAGNAVGVIRISLFSEKAFPDACAAAVVDLSIPDGKSCDGDCVDQLERRTGDILLRRLEARIVALRRAGATSLLVDITGNGGGSDWVDPVARSLAPVALREPRMAFVRHAHWTRQLETGLADVETDLRAGRGPTDVLRSTAKKLREAVASSKQPCDRTALWDGGAISCSLLSSGYRFAEGVIPYARPGAFRDLVSRTFLFQATRYAYKERINRMPLLVAVDRNSWSAAEYFAAVLKDNRAALIVGELTGGAGCGFTNGGIPTNLSNSGATVRMPDCVRLRADGSNEVAGITPDVLVPWAPRDSSFQRASKLARALATNKRTEE